MPHKICLDCLRPFDPKLAGAGRSRCPTHERAYQARQTRAKRARRPYTASERTRRAQTVTAHVEAHGWWCPGWQRDPHPSHDLTADHWQAVGGGGHESGVLVVLCRSCNSSRGTQPYA